MRSNYYNTRRDKSVERIFWVECPQCHGRFYCDYELRYSKYELYCPYCNTTFLPEASPWIDDRG